jgi:ABC-type ATPase with predicted acetyltransferase domain
MSQSLISFKSRYLAQNTGEGEKKRARLSRMYKKRKRLAMNREFHAEIDVIEIKRFN